MKLSIVFPEPNISAHDGVEEENLTEDDDAGQAENCQPYNKAVQSITTDKEDKDIEAKGNKSFSLKIPSILQPSRVKVR
jgi:hypothetical protein